MSIFQKWKLYTIHHLNKRKLLPTTKQYVFASSVSFKSKILLFCKWISMNLSSVANYVSIFFYLWMNIPTNGHYSLFCYNSHLKSVMQFYPLGILIKNWGSSNTFLLSLQRFLFSFFEIYVLLYIWFNAGFELEGIISKYIKCNIFNSIKKFSYYILRE